MVWFLAELGFQRCAGDIALYLSIVGRASCIWVDNLLMLNKEQMPQVVDKILTKCNACDLMEVSYVLGMEVICDRQASTITTMHTT